MQNKLLGVNIDHVATIRQARGTTYPDPIHAAQIAEIAGADGITLHLREDRRHIQDRDVFILKETCQTRINLEMAVTEAMLKIALQVQPQHVCLVPEKREELTTEGGLDVINHFDKVNAACQQLTENGIIVSLFIDPDNQQIEAAKKCEAPFIEIHTGAYADAIDEKSQSHELTLIANAANYAASMGLKVNAGHGLHYHNVQSIAQIPEIIELNIGHAIIARALMSGMHEAVSTMKQLII